MAEIKQEITRVYKDKDLNFVAHPVTGDVSKKLDVAAVKQALRILLLTNTYEKPFHPEISGNIRGLLFENMTPLTALAIKKQIETVLTNFERRVKIQEVKVLPNSSEDGYNIEIYFYTVGITKPAVFNFTLERLR